MTRPCTDGLFESPHVITVPTSIGQFHCLLFYSASIEYHHHHHRHHHSINL